MALERFGRSRRTACLFWPIGPPRPSRASRSRSQPLWTSCPPSEVTPEQNACFFHNLIIRVVVEFDCLARTYADAHPAALACLDSDFGLACGAYERRFVGASPDARQAGGAFLLSDLGDDSSELNLPPLDEFPRHRARRDSLRLGDL